MPLNAGKGSVNHRQLQTAPFLDDSTKRGIALRSWFKSYGLLTGLYCLWVFFSWNHCAPLASQGIQVANRPTALAESLGTIISRWENESYPFD